MAGDVGNEQFCRDFIAFAVEMLGGIDIVVNNAAEQHPQDSIEHISESQLDRTFRTNLYSMFFITKAAAPYLSEGSSVINTGSVTAYNGNPTLLDYSATKGAIAALTRSLSQGWAEKGIRVNAVAPGPIWTPLIPSTFPPEKVASFGQNTPLGRAGQPDEVAMSYVFLAASDSSYITGQTIHVNGGKFVAS
jgi:NAD(P)-dependent dehydrogenase (short-subunit alcohol dehydrogenase family)